MPFYPQQPRKSKFWKNNKSIWRCHHFTQMCTKNHSHMMYASLSMESNRHNFLSFWAIFYPFTPPNKPKNQDIKKWKKKKKNKTKHQEISSFSGIKWTNFKLFVKKPKMPKMPRPTAVVNTLGLHELFLPCFLAFAESKNNHQRVVF